MIDLPVPAFPTTAAPRLAAAVLLMALALSGCAAARPPAPVEEDPPAVVPAGIKPLTVEQEEDGAAMLPVRASWGLGRP